MSHVDVQAEVATSRPQQNAAGQAYVESFESEGAVNVPMSEAAWYFSSQPALGSVLPARLGASTFDLERASTMAWQNAGLNRAGFNVQFTLADIDPQVTLTGAGITAPEQLLWMTLYPLGTGGLLNDRTGTFQWTVDGAPTGRRWRSLRAGLGPSGADLSRVEYIEFWTLADTSLLRRATNPTLVIDLGDASENSVVFGPTDLNLTPVSSGVNDSSYKGKVFIGLDHLEVIVISKFSFQ
jgi:cell surface protein SprA